MAVYRFYRFNQISQSKEELVITSDTRLKESILRAIFAEGWTTFPIEGL